MISQYLVVNYFGTFFGIGPLATLVAFIAVPAYKRMVFVAGMACAWYAFALSFLRIAIPWIIQRDFIQEGMRNATVWAIKEKARANQTRAFDEL